MSRRTSGLALTLVLATASAGDASVACLERDSNTCGGWRTINLSHIVSADGNRSPLEPGERFELSPARALEIAAAELRRARHLGEGLRIAALSPTEETCGGISARFYSVHFYSLRRCRTGTETPHASILLTGDEGHGAGADS